jgi:hypothetical protein
MRRLAASTLLVAVGVAAPNCSDPAAPGEVVTQHTLDWYNCLDLESGASRECTSFHGEPEIMTGEDFWLACCSGVWTAVFHNQAEAQIAHLNGRRFADVRLADTSGAAWSTQLVSEPFDTTRTVLIRTGAGNVYKLGNPEVLGGPSYATRFDTAPLN